MVDSNAASPPPRRHLHIENSSAPDSPNRNPLSNEALEELMKQFPPNPLLPKSFITRGESPKSGNGFGFLSLAKFKGRDYGRSKYGKNGQIEQIEFESGTTFKDLFYSKGDESVVYLRSASYPSVKNFGGKKDCVLEENLLDVKNLL